MSGGIWWIDTDKAKHSAWRKTYVLTILIATNPTWTGLGPNQDLCWGPVTNFLAMAWTSCL